MVCQSSLAADTATLPAASTTFGSYDADAAATAAANEDDADDDDDDENGDVHAHDHEHPEAPAASAASTNGSAQSSSIANIKAQHKATPFKMPYPKHKLAHHKHHAAEKSNQQPAAVVAATDNSSAKSPADLASPTYIPVSEKPPAGFEYLNEPVQTMVDVYYAGSYIATVSAVYTPTTIHFGNPATFLDKIPNIQNRTLVQKILSSDLPTHSQLVCPGQPNPRCGTLNPDIAGVIFNANKFRVDLFISSNYLAPGTPPSPFIPAPDAGFSAVSDIYGAANGIENNNSNGSNSYGVRAVNDVGYKNTMFHSEFSDSKNEFTNNESDLTSFHVDQLNVAHYFDSQYVARGGILETVGDAFTGNQTYAGISVGTTLDTLQEDSTTFGSQLQVFLPTASYVSIYREGRLLATKYYPAGNQILDTSTLPSGAYQVEIRIRDLQGNITSQTQFFSKTSQIAPMAFPQYYASVGYLQEDPFQETTVMPQFGVTPVFQVGHNKRIQPNWGIGADVLGTDHVALASAGVFLLEPDYQISPQLLYGTNQEEGVGLSVQSTINNFSSSLFARQIWTYGNAYENPADSGLPYVDPLALPGYQDPLTLPVDSTQADLSFGYTFPRVYAAFTAHVNKYADFPSAYSYGPMVRFPIMHDNGTNLDMNISATRSNANWQVLAQLTVYFTAPQWITSASAGYQSISDENVADAPLPGQASGFVGNVNTYWQQLDAAQQGTILGVSGNTQPGINTVGANGQYTDPLGGVQANIQRNTGSTITPNTQYAGDFNTHVVYADQHATVGGAQAAENTGVIVDIESPTPGDEFQVLVNDQVVQIVKSGHQTPIFLMPFKTYHIRIKAVSQHFYEYSETPKTVTLYHGNFKTLIWKTQQKVIVFGYIDTPNGKPLGNTLIHGGVGINATDTDGSAQIELYDDVTQLTAHLPDNRPCVINLPKLDVDRAVTLVNHLVCEPEKK